MGTRGFVGFVVGGVEKIAYNHWDSYPSGLGDEVLGWLRSAGSEGLPAIREQARALRVVDPQSKPAPEDIERLRPWTDLGVGEQSTADWYCLLRRTQGNPGAMLEAGTIEDGAHFPTDSLFAEWGYIVDFDTAMFEAYEGFQKSAHTEGRFALRTGPDDSNGYFPVKLVAAWPLGSLPSAEEFIAKLEPPDADE